MRLLAAKAVVAAQATPKTANGSFKPPFDIVEQNGVSLTPVSPVVSSLQREDLFVRYVRCTAASAGAGVASSFSHPGIQGRGRK